MTADTTSLSNLLVFLLEGSILFIFIKLFLFVSFLGLFKKILFNKKFFLFVLFIILVYFLVPQTQTFINLILNYILEGVVSVIQILTDLIKTMLNQIS